MLLNYCNIFVLIKLIYAIMFSSIIIYIQLSISAYNFIASQIIVVTQTRYVFIDLYQHINWSILLLQIRYHYEAFDYMCSTASFSYHLDKYQ